MIVLCDGVFDPLHIGHVRYLQKAATYGHVVVRVAPDEAIVAKGRTPLQTRAERLVMLEALRVVTAVHDDETLAGAVQRLRPNFLAKGSDWRDKLPDDVVRACYRYHIPIVFTETVARTSSERLRATS